jgi:soluble lytic murein transglycosylase-like protein
MDHESGGDPDALNPTSSAAGLFQVMPFWWDHYGGDRFNPETNVRVAALIKADQGWTAWSPYNRGECR